MPQIHGIHPLMEECLALFYPSLAGNRYHVTYMCGKKTSHSLVEIHENAPSAVPCDHLGKNNLPPRKIGIPS